MKRLLTSVAAVALLAASPAMADSKLDAMIAGMHQGTNAAPAIDYSPGEDVESPREKLDHPDDPVSVSSEEREYTGCLAHAKNWEPQKYSCDLVNGDIMTFMKEQEFPGIAVVNGATAVIQAGAVRFSVSLDGLSPDELHDLAYQCQTDMPCRARFHIGNVTYNPKSFYVGYGSLIGVNDGWEWKKFGTLYDVRNNHEITTEYLAECATNNAKITAAREVFQQQHHTVVGLGVMPAPGQSLRDAR